MKLPISYQDEHLVVVEKPPGLLAQADRTGDPDVVRILKERYGAEGAARPFIGLVHRLDRPASGLMVLGRTSEAARHLSAQFRERTVDKRYLAIVDGALAGLGTWTDYLVKENRSVRTVRPDHPDGKRAELSWQALAQSEGRSLLQVRLHTGRAHQIRVQCARRGHPILGDFRYGATRELDGQNLALHGYLLAVEHPATHRGMRWRAAPPAAWDPALNPPFRTAIQRLHTAG